MSEPKTLDEAKAIITQLEKRNKQLTAASAFWMSQWIQKGNKLKAIRGSIESA